MNIIYIINHGVVNIISSPFYVHHIAPSQKCTKCIYYCFMYIYFCHNKSSEYMQSVANIRSLTCAIYMMMLCVYRCCGALWRWQCLVVVVFPGGLHLFWTHNFIMYVMMNKSRSIYIFRFTNVYANALTIHTNITHIRLFNHQQL